MMKISNIKDIIDEKFILILTSNSNEKRVIDELLQYKTSILISNNISGKIGLISDDIVLHLSGDLGISKNNSIGQIAISFFGNDYLPKPILTILAGVCWGNSKLTNIGDVLISNSILNCNIKRLDGTPVRPLTLSSSFDISYFIDNPVTLFSQETYVGDTDAHLRDELLKKFDYLYGGEMEGFYFLKENTPWIITKVVADFGDKLNREKQIEVLPNIKASIYNLLKSRIKDHDFYTTELTEFTTYLNGRNLQINRNETNLDNIQINLIEKYSQLIDHNLNNYKSSDPKFYDAKNILESFILEICSNAISHGNASDIKIEFLNNQIKIIDNGYYFDINTLSKENGGGSEDLNSLKDYNDLITITSQQNQSNHQNIYKIIFSQEIQSIVQTKVECPISILSFGRYPELSYDETCSAFYIDLSKRFMRSMAEGLCSHISNLLKDNQKLAFIKVKNQRQLDVFNSCFTELVDNTVSSKDIINRINLFE